MSRLTMELVLEAEKLLLGGTSQRKVARLLKISRSSVANIAHGKRPRVRSEDVNELFNTSKPPVRCRGCGGMVYIPCWLCEVRRLKALDEPKPFRRAA